MKKAGAKRLWLLWLLAAFACTVRAQDHTLSFDKFTLPDISQNRMVSSFQDSKGYLWLSTTKGVWRYDGYLLQKYTLSNSALQHNAVKAVNEDQYGNILISASGLHIIRPGNKRLEHIAFQPVFQDGFYRAWTGKIAVYLNDIWIGSWKHVNRFDGRTFGLKKQYAYNGALINDANNHPVVDRAGRLWNASTSGLLQYDPQVDSFVYAAAQGEMIQELIAAGTNKLLATSPNGLWEIDLNTKQTKQVVSFADHSKYYSLAEVNINHQPMILMSGGSSGLLQYDPQTQQTYPFTRNIFDDRTHNNEWVNHIFQRSAKAPVIIATNKGPELINHHQFTVQRYYTSVLKQLVIHDFYITGNSGVLLATDQGLFRYMPAANSLQLMGGMIQAVFQFTLLGNSHLLLTSATGLFDYDPVAGSIKKHTAVQPGIIQCRLYNNQVWMIDKDGRLLVYDHQLKNRLEPYDRKQYNEHLAKRKVSCFAIDRLNRLWIGATGGFYVYDPIKKSIENYSLQDGKVELDAVAVNNILCARDGSIWVATWGELWHLNEQGKVLGYFGGKFVEDIQLQNIVQDASGRIWLGNGDGVYLVDAMKKQMTLFNYSAGLLENNALHGFRLLGNKLFVAHQNGFSVIDTKGSDDEADVLPPVVTQVEIMGKPLDSLSQNLVLKRSDKTVTFRFSSMLFNLEPFVRYRYKLEGFDQDWQTLAGEPQCSYSNLSPGNYSLAIQAVSNGITREATMAFRVLPAFYETWWFFVLLGIALAGVIAGIVKIRTAQLMKIQQVRNRIARDLHDDMGSTLSSVNIYSKLLQSQQGNELLIARISDNIGALNESLKDIIWNVSPRKDSLTELIDRLKDYVFSIQSSMEVNAKLHCDITQDKKLSIGQRRNLFLIVKEFVNNSLKHSGCTVLEIGLTLDRRWLQVTLSDNGKGFDIAAVHKGNGLNNMMERSAEIGAVYTLVSHPEKGTSCTVRLKIA